MNNYCKCCEYHKEKWKETMENGKLCRLCRYDDDRIVEVEE